ncbi:MAG: sulfite exporter TauE/SafE family protein [Deltaproteobacteria bacterium]|nr:sulfite exporter TauE/SafE family protein [Deltaproteobacteria bacterium]
MFAESVSYPAAFIAGLLSFFSPCVLPLIPAYFTFITGFSLEELTTRRDMEIRRKVILATIAFVSGFSLVFIFLGASATFLGDFMTRQIDAIRVTGGIVIIILGLHMTGLIRIRLLEFDKRMHLKNKPLHFFGTFIVGMAFGAGWSPCIGPQLTTILFLAANEETIYQGVFLLGVYSLGMGLPFLVLSAFINLILLFIKKVVPVMKYLNIAAGILLIVVGLLLVTNKFLVFAPIS